MVKRTEAEQARMKELNIGLAEWLEKENVDGDDSVDLLISTVAQMIAVANGEDACGALASIIRKALTERLGQVVDRLPLILVLARAVEQEKPDPNN